MDLLSLIQDGSTSYVYLAVIGLILGSLHGLEPGHSKTMMAAFIVAVRGTPLQALLLGLSAAISHSIIVWILAVLALTYGDELIGEKLEPYFIVASGVIIVGVGAFMLYRAHFAGRPQKHTAHSDHHHHHRHEHDHIHAHGHPRTYDAQDYNGPVDAHALAHARELEQRFAEGRATNLQTIGFGLVGGLIPCPAAITVLLLCLGIGQTSLGIGMVMAFSAGLALTLVGVGMVAAIGVRYATTKGAFADRLMRLAPSLSGALIILVGLYMTYSGFHHLSH